MVLDPVLNSIIEYDAKENMDEYVVTAMVTMPIQISVRAKDRVEALDKVTNEEYDKDDDIEYIKKEMILEEIVNVEVE